jgi:hypothetical protein
VTKGERAKKEGDDGTVREPPEGLAELQMKIPIQENYT